METKGKFFLLGVFVLVIGACDLARAQGTATLLQDELLGINQDSKWHGFVSTGYSRNRDQFSDGFYRTSFQLSYDLKPGRQVYANIAYLRPDSRYEDDVLRFGFSDLSVGLTQAAFKWKLSEKRAINCLAFFEGSAPTSDRSRRASLLGLATAGLAMNTMVSKKLILTSSHSFSYGLYQFDTSNQLGTQYNAPYFVGNGLSAIVRLTNQLNWINGYSFTYLENFNGTVIKINGLSSTLSYIYTPKISFGTFARWRDRLVTNNQLFDDDTVVTGAFGRYIF